MGDEGRVGVCLCPLRFEVLFFFLGVVVGVLLLFPVLSVLFSRRRPVLSRRRNMDVGRELGLVGWWWCERWPAHSESIACVSRRKRERSVTKDLAGEIRMISRSANLSG